MDIPVLIVHFTHFYQHCFEPSFYGTVCPFYYAIRGLVVVGDENHPDVKGPLEVLSEPGYEGIAIVTTNRLAESIPLDPPM